MVRRVEPIPRLGFRPPDDRVPGIEVVDLATLRDRTILAGHGLPAGPEIFAELRRYLSDARDLLGDDGEAYKKAILDRYPAYGGALLIDIANQYLFGA